MMVRRIREGEEIVFRGNETIIQCPICHAAWMINDKAVDDPDCPHLRFHFVGRADVGPGFVRRFGTYESGDFYDRFWKEARGVDEDGEYIDELSAFQRLVHPYVDEVVYQESAPSQLPLTSYWGFTTKTPDHNQGRAAEGTGKSALSKQDILAAVTKARSQIQDLTVTYSWNALKAPADAPNFRSRVTATVQKGKTLMDHEYGPDPQYNLVIWHRRVAFNGERSTFYQVDWQTAITTRKRSWETNTQGYEFFNMMLLNPPRGRFDGVSGQSLLSVLSSGLARLRPELENVDGRPCYVIVVYQGYIFGRSRPHLTVWLDAERGFLPVRQKYEYGQAMEFRVEQAAEIKPGLWFAVRGTKQVYDDKGTIESDYRLEVDGWKEGCPAIAINRGLAADFFDLWKQLPWGTRLFDEETRETVVVSGTTTPPNE